MEATCQTHVRCSTVFVLSRNTRGGCTVRGVAGTEHPHPQPAAPGLCSHLPTKVPLGPAFLLSKALLENVCMKPRPCLSSAKARVGPASALMGDPRQERQGPFGMHQPSAEGGSEGPRQPREWGHRAWPLPPPPNAFIDPMAML